MGPGPSPLLPSPLRRPCSLSYADASSADGLLAADTFALRGAAPVPAALFGCITSYHSSTATDNATTGLLGMNRGALSFVTQMGTRRFAYCIASGDAPGLLVLGGTATASPALNYTPLVEASLPLPYFDRTAYSVHLEGIRVGRALLPISKSALAPDHTGAGQTMVDSGTQFTFLLGAAYAALRSEFTRQTRPFLPALDEDFAFQEAFDTCFRVPAGRPPPAARLPAVTLLFKGAEMAVAGDRLLYRVPGERRGRGGGDAVWCLTFGNADMVPLTAYVLGHHHQMNVWVEYDLERGRVGLASVKCDVASQRLGLML